MSARRLLLLAGLAHCGGIDAPSGDGALARVPGARFVPGARPAVTGSGRITEIQSANNEVRAGQRGKSVSGRATGGTYTIALGLDGDVGYWIVPVTARSVLTPGEVEWEALVDFDAALPPGPRALWMQAGDGRGAFGPGARLDLAVRATIPSAAVVVSLRWDVDADLNLSVVAPDGTTISNRGTRHPDGAAVRIDPRVGPALDVDSNARCARDGRRAENVAWSARAPGNYSVRVEAWSLCGFASARYTLDVYDRGVVVARARGAAFDTAVPTTGASLEVLRFDLPP